MTTVAAMKPGAISTVDRCFEVIELRMPREDFHRLPRNPAYKYEYFDGCALLTPRPNVQFLRLNLPAELDADAHLGRGSDPLVVRGLDEADWDELAPAFAFAFERIPPFGTLPHERQTEAAEAALRETREGLHGELVAAASCVAAARDFRVGACMVTRPTTALWQPPEMSGQPHLSWIFVSPTVWRHGAATAMLSWATQQLHALGHEAFCSTFLVGNA